MSINQVSDASIIEMYSRFFTSDKVTAKFRAFADSTAGYFGELVGQLDDTDLFQSKYQSMVIRSEVTYTLRELMQAAPLQIQAGLDAARVQRIWEHRTTGLMSTGVLFRLPTVGVMSDGSINLLAGNHRIAAPTVMLLRAGADPDAVLNQNIAVEQFEIDREELGRRMGGKSASHPEVLAQADRLLWALWEADNDTRRMSAAEVKDADLLRSNVDLSDPDELLNGMFSSPKRLTLAQGMRYSTVKALKDGQDYPQGIAPFSLTGDTWNTDAAFSITTTTLDAISTAYFTGLGKVSEEIVKGDGVKVVKLYSKDLKNPEMFADFAQYFAENLGFAVNTVMNETTEWEGNVAKNARRIGAFLAESYASDIDPVDDPRNVATKAPKAARSTAPKGLGLAL